MAGRRKILVGNRNFEIAHISLVVKALVNEISQRECGIL